MTAFTNHLVAMTLEGGRYGVHSQIDAALDEDALNRDGLLHDVSANSSYLDDGALLSRADLPKYLPAPDTANRAQAWAWYRSLPDSVWFIVYHAAQFESGFGD